jgi:hypothetical protein
MKVSVEYDVLKGSCGVGIVYLFEEIKPNEDYDYTPVESKGNGGGAGWCCAGFIDTPECQAVFKKIKAAHPIVLKTPVRYNNNSSNNFFFMVWDCHHSLSPANVKKKNNKYRWPKAQLESIHAL